MQSITRIIILVIIVSIVFGSLSALAILRWQRQSQKSSDELISDFYLTEVAVQVSPHGLRKKMDKEDNNFILVDLRSREEYEKEHIIGAINIPAYKDPNTSAYGDVERIVEEFSKLDQDKDIIVYCYSIPCMTGRKIGKILAEHNIYVKHLGIGWNEWRYFWSLWNHEHEWVVTTVNDYVGTGSEPGIMKSRNSTTSCPIDGGFDC